MRGGLLLALAIVLVPMPALADITVRYAVGGQVLSVEIDSDGSSRVGVDGAIVLIHRDGADYAICPSSAGAPAVVALGDFIAVVEQVAREDPAPRAPARTFALTRVGTETIGGFASVNWELGPAERQPAANTLVFAMTGDAALAPVAAELRRYAAVILPLIDEVAAPGSNLVALLTQVFEKGVPVRIAPFVELMSVDTAEIPAERFVLPGPVVSAESLQGALPLPPIR